MWHKVYLLAGRSAMRVHHGKRSRNHADVWVVQRRRKRRLRKWRLDDHDWTASVPYHDFGHAAEQKAFEDRGSVRPHHDQVATELVEHFKDACGAGSIRHDNLMFNVYAGLGRLDALKSIPQVDRFSRAGIGQETSSFRHNGRRAARGERGSPLRPCCGPAYGPRGRPHRRGLKNRSGQGFSESLS